MLPKTTFPGAAFRLALLVVALATLATTTGCGYRVSGRASALPPGIKTIAVPAFENRTSTYRIEQRLTGAIVREMLARTSFRVVANPDGADAVLRGGVTNISSTATVFDPATGAATAILVTVIARVRLVDRASGKVLYRNDNIVFREPYEISTNVQTFFQEEGPALDRMARDFAARIVADLVEGL